MRPTATIIKPSWLDVEKATIFLISFWVRAHTAAKKLVKAPRHITIDRQRGLSVIRGLKRIIRITPATTIVLECSRAETGVGPSMAAGSQG